MVATAATVAGRLTGSRRETMTEEMDVATLGSLLADDCARTILKATAQEPRSAAALEERCEASKTTVYRRLDALESHALLEVKQRPDERGHHHKVYAASLDEAVITLTDDGMECRLSRRDRMARRLTEFIEEL
jgi:predicted transcriptional regulator